jgi:hypothetical protein
MSWRTSTVKNSRKKAPSLSNARHLKHWTHSVAVSALYEQLNTSLFNGILPNIPCYYNPRLSRCLGRCLYYQDKDEHVPYAIDLGPGAQGENLFETLIHEMVHVWQGVLGYTLGHDATFHRCLAQKSKVFQTKCDAGELSNQPVPILPNLQPIRSDPPTRKRTRTLPKSGWIRNTTYDDCFLTVNSRYFNDLLPGMIIYENPRLTRSICRLHVQYEDGKITISAGDVMPKTRAKRLNSSLLKLLQQCLSNMMLQPDSEILPSYRAAYDYISQHPPRRSS